MSQTRPSQRRNTLILVLAVSIGLHVVALLLFGAYKVVETITREEQSFEAPPVEAPPPEPVPPVELMRRNQQSSAPSVAPIVLDTPDLELPELDIDFDVQSRSAYGRGAGGFGRGAGGGASIREMAIDIESFEFFGKEFKTQGDRMLFVIDISASMIDPRNRGIDGYKTVVAEVVKTLESMQRGNFNILAFASGVDSYRGSFTSLSPSKVRDAERWLLSMDPAPGRIEAEKRGEKPDWTKYKDGRNTGTRTDLAMEEAFNKRPSTIILLSDGVPSKVSKEDNYTLVQELQTIPKTPIHTISYKSPAAGEFLRILAEQNDGTFTMIE
ncbi:MAG: VWA domain-containing protein [Coraliomargarita sp.]|nr:VWA domain-containing protein [Coraliomargarita sp.]